MAEPVFAEWRGVALMDPLDPPDVLLKRALELALPERPRLRPSYERTTERAITRRGLVWLGQTCNLRCHFCYYLDRIDDAEHPEHAFMSLEKAKAICRTLVETYGNNSVDIQGGEPTLWPHIVELVRFCAEIGLSPTVITNAQVLDRPERVVPFRQAGLRDFIVSVQGIGPVYDYVVGRRGAHERQMRALRHLQEAAIPFRFNTVLTRAVLPQLPQIAELAVRTGAFVVNFLAYNPFDDQRISGKRSAANVPSYTEVGPYLDAALDVLAASGVEGNARYLPLCVVSERHRASVYGFQQLPYDLHENDFASWSWTTLQPQRMRDGELTPPFPLGPRVRLGPLRGLARRLSEQPVIGPALVKAKRGADRWLSTLAAGLGRNSSREERYRREGRLRAQEHCDYQYARACASCDARKICDGFQGDYARLLGMDDVSPLRLGGAIDSPIHFVRRQEKTLHPDDARWVGS